jgi:hypothetical protein
MRILKSLFGKPQKLTKNDYFGMVINNNDVIPNSPLIKILINIKQNKYN